MNPPTDVARAEGGRKSYERIFVSTFVIGGASVMNIVIGLVRMKAVALLLGPAGVGLIGLLGTLMTTAATITQMGVATVGTRQIAEAHASGDGHRLAISRKALLTATLVLAVLGGSTVWLLQIPLARLAVGDASAASSVAVLALGVALSVAATAQIALVQGMRRMRDLASITVFGALATTIVGVPLIWWRGIPGIAAYLVLGPLVSFVLGRWYVARLPKAGLASISLAELRPQWVMFLRLGAPFMGAAVAATLVELWIRIDVRQQLGDEALGQFHASWTIAAQYVGFVLGAMAADYYPRLTAAMRDPAEATANVNQQTEVALLLSGPAILAMLGLAPVVVDLLYSGDFAPAADVLRWQALATALKVASWPLGFVLLAAGDGRTFFWTEVLILAFMAAALHLLLRPLGVEGAGMAYLAAYLLYLPLMHWLAVRRISFRWTRDVVRTMAALAALLTVLETVIFIAPRWVVPASILCTALFGAYALWRMQQFGLIGAIGVGLARARMFTIWRTREES